MKTFKDALAAQVKAMELAASKPHYGTVDITEPDRTCLSWWFPKLITQGLPVPETRIVALNYGREIGNEVFDNRQSNGVTEAVSELLIAMASDARIGWPCFLRTGHFSGKHDWKNTCFVQSPGTMLRQMSNLAMLQEMVGCHPQNHLSVWVVRKMLPTKPVVTCTRYGDFPLTREIRVFVEDGRVAYTAPYWPEGAISEGVPEHDHWNLHDVQGFTDEELADVTDLASKAGMAVGGRWSVDILDTEDGWYVTDLAEAEKSYGFDPGRY